MKTTPTETKKQTGKSKAEKSKTGKPKKDLKSLSDNATNAATEAKKLIAQRPKVRLPGSESEITPFFRNLGQALCGSHFYRKNDRLFVAELIDDDGTPCARLRAPTATSLPEDLETSVRIVKITRKKTRKSAADGEGGVEEVDGKIVPKEKEKKEKSEEATEEIETTDTERAVSLPDKLAPKAIQSTALKQGLREIRNIEQVRLPVLSGGKLQKLTEGYDPCAKVYSANSVNYDTDMPLTEARGVIDDWWGQFDFGDAGRSKAVLIAFSISEFVRYLLPADVLRPVCITQCNAPGGGKTIALQMSMGPVHGLAAVTGYPKNSEEMRKKIAGAFEDGERLIIIDNVEGYCNDPTLCQVVTSPSYKDRFLGQTGGATWEHESQIMISGNNIRVGPDLARRSLIVDLRQRAERPELRTVETPFSGQMLETNRPRLLAALWSITSHWVSQGMPSGPTILGTFSDWSRIVGGIVTAAGWEDPCQVISTADVDPNGQDARTLVQALASGAVAQGQPAIDAKSGRKPSEIREWILNEELFSSILSGAKTPQALASACGKILATWTGRDCAGYRLQHDHAVNNSRRRYWVEKIPD